MLPAWVLHSGDKCKHKHCMYLLHQQRCTTSDVRVQTSKSQFSCQGFPSWTVHKSLKCWVKEVFFCFFIFVLSGIRGLTQSFFPENRQLITIIKCKNSLVSWEMQTLSIHSGIERIPFCNLSSWAGLAVYSEMLKTSATLKIDKLQGTLVKSWIISPLS